MTEIKTEQLVAMFGEIASAIEQEKGRLSQLDGVIGDADHGITMALGFGAVSDKLRGLDLATTEPSAIFNIAAKAFLNAVGASSGPLYATAFMRAGTSVKGRTFLDRDSIVDVVLAMARGIQERGKAERGDKTMVDAWLPAAEAAETARESGKTLADCLAEALTAARAGADATKSMVASKGRASRLGERAIGHIDPGAASAVVILDAMARTLTS